MSISILCDWGGVLDSRSDPEALKTLLKEYRAMGIDVYLATDMTKSHAQEEFDTLKKENVVNKLISSSDAGVMKNSEDYMFDVCEKYDLNKHEVIFIDDSPANIMFAKRNGVTSVWVDADNRWETPLKVKSAYQEKACNIH